jgi:hypothetical protein
LNSKNKKKEKVEKGNRQEKAGEETRERRKEIPKGEKEKRRKGENPKMTCLLANKTITKHRKQSAKSKVRILIRAG